MPRRSLFALVAAPLWISAAVTRCDDSTAVHDVAPHWGRARSEAELISQFEIAYRTRDFDNLRLLFHPEYRFFLNEPQPDGTTSWDLTDELRIQRRMFRPQDPVPGENPVPQDLWLVGIDLSLSARAPFEDPIQWYEPIENPNGLDPDEYAVRYADYIASVFFRTQGETQYRIEGRLTFVVVNDRSKALGDEGKFLIYRWEDLGFAGMVAAEQKSWSSVKVLYE